MIFYAWRSRLLKACVIRPGKFWMTENDMIDFESLWHLIKAPNNEYLKLTHCGLIMHMCAVNWIICSDNGLVPLRYQAVTWTNIECMPTGPRFNIKMSSYHYRNSHCGDKTVVRSSYIHNGISYTGKMTFYIESGPWTPWNKFIKIRFFVFKRMHFPKFRKQNTIHYVSVSMS